MRTSAGETELERVYYYCYSIWHSNPNLTISMRQILFGWVHTKTPTHFSNAQLISFQFWNAEESYSYHWISSDQNTYSQSILSRFQITQIAMMKMSFRIPSNIRHFSYQSRFRVVHTKLLKRVGFTILLDLNNMRSQQYQNDTIKSKISIKCMSLARQVSCGYYPCQALKKLRNDKTIWLGVRMSWLSSATEATTQNQPKSPWLSGLWR